MQQTDFKNEMVLNGLSCPNCAAAIEDKINKLPWVKDARINLATQILTLDTEAETIHSGAKKELQNLIDRIEDGVVLQSRDEPYGRKGEAVFISSLIQKIPQLIGALLFISLLVLSSRINLASRTRIMLFALSYLLTGHTVILTAFKNIRHGRVLDENFLMVAATIGAFAIREYHEAVAVMLFYQVGEFFQGLAVDGSRRSIRNLLDSKPGLVRVKNEGNVIETAAEDVKPGMEILVRPGDRVPLDGVVLKGRASVDTSALTGESYPRQVREGASVLSGFVCMDSPLEIEVSRTLEESAYSRIIRMVEESSGRKARSEQFITRFARIYTPAVVVSAVLLAFLPPLFIQDAAFSPWIYRALVFLVVSCPCAIVVSVPLSFFAGIGKASRSGILVKGGNYLEALNRIDTVILDKTGTLTKGVFRVSSLHPQKGTEQDELLHLAASVEAHSSHPIALSIRQAWEEHSSLLTLPEADSIREVPGRGIRAEIDGSEIYLGKKSWLEELCGTLPDNSVGTGVYLSRDGEFLGYLVLSDEVREDAEYTVDKLRKEGIKRVIMLTGDSEETASQVASALKIHEYQANLLPGEKVRALESFAAEGCTTVFAGDGINDAPVLARADVGIAMGGLGSDAAIEAADIVLMSDEPAKILTARRIARRTRGIVVQNIVMALGVKGIVLGLAALGLAGMGLAVFADVGVALLAVLNAMRILLFRE